MSKKDLTRMFIVEIYSEPPMKIYPTNRIVCYHNDEIWSIDLADMTDYKSSNNKGFTYIFVNIDNISKYTWCIPLKKKNSQTIKNEIANILTTSEPKTLKMGSDRGTEFNTIIFQNF